MKRQYSNMTPATASRKGFALMALLLMALLLMVWGGVITSAQASDCRLTLSRPVVDYGRWTPGVDGGPARGNRYALEESDVVVNAFCDEPQKIALFFSGTPRDGGFLFGDKGVMTVVASQAMLDGKHVRLGKSTGQNVLNVEGSAEESAIVNNNDGLMPVTDQQIVIGQQFQLTLRLKPLMNASGLKPADQTLLKSDLNIRVEAE